MNILKKTWKCYNCGNTAVSKRNIERVYCAMCNKEMIKD